MGPGPHPPSGVEDVRFPYRVNVRVWFHHTNTGYRLSRFTDTNWSPGKGESALPNGFIGTSSYSGQLYVWAEAVEYSEYDNELCALLGLTMSEDRK